MRMCKALRIARRKRQMMRYKLRHRSHRTKTGHNYRLDKVKLENENIRVCAKCGKPR